MNTPPSGFPRPLSKDQSQSDYHAREMDEKARKEREDRQRKLVLQKRDLELKQMDLRVQEDKHSALRREITKMESQPGTFLGKNFVSVIDTKNSEHQKTVKTAEIEKEIAVIEKEVLAAERSMKAEENLSSEKNRQSEAQGDKEGRLVVQKEQEEKIALNRIAEIKETIRVKNLELNRVESEDAKIRQEIGNLKNQPKKPVGLRTSKKRDVANITEDKRAIEKLRAEIAGLNQSFEIKKQETEKANEVSLEKKKLTEAQSQLLQQKTQEAILAVNRINGIKDDIKLIQDRIRALEI